MTVAQILPVALTVVGLSLASTLILIVTRQGFHDDSPAVAALSHDVNAAAGGDERAHSMSGDV